MRPQPKKQKTSNIVTTTSLLGTLKIDLLGQIIRHLNYDDIIELTKTSRSIHKSIREIIFKNPDIILTLIRNHIRYYFNSTIDFATLYNEEQHRKLVTAPSSLKRPEAVVFNSTVDFPPLHNEEQHKKLVTESSSLELLEAVVIVGKRLSSQYQKAFKTLNDYSKKNWLEANFLITQLIRLDYNNNQRYMGPIVHEGFRHAEYFYEQYPDQLNSQTLAHFHFLLHSENKRLPLAVDHKASPFKTSSMMNKAMDNLLNPSASGNNVNLVARALPLAIMRARNLRRQNAAQVDSIIVDIQVSDYFKTAINELIVRSFNSISSGMKQALENLNTEMKWQYVIAFCTPGANLLIDQLIKYSLIEELFKLSPSQIEHICQTDILWLFDVYGAKTIAGIQDLSKKQTAKGESKTINLEFLEGKQIKDYIKQQKRTPSLQDVWQIEPSISNPVFKTKEFATLSKSNTNLVRIATKLKDLEANGGIEAYNILAKVLKPKVALELTSQGNVFKTEAEMLVKYLGKFSFLKKINMSHFYNLIIETPEDVLEKVAEFIDKHSDIELHKSILTFIINLHKHAKAINDDELPERVRLKMPHINIMKQYQQNTTLNDLFANHAEEPWFQLLSFEQITSINPRVLPIITNFDKKLQEIVLKNLLVTYEKKPFTPTAADVRSFAIVAKDFLEKQKKLSDLNDKNGPLDKSRSTDVTDPKVLLDNQSAEEQQSDNNSTVARDDVRIKIIKNLITQNDNLKNQVENQNKLIAKLRKKIHQLEGNSAKYLSNTRTPAQYNYSGTEDDKISSPIHSMSFFSASSSNSDSDSDGKTLKRKLNNDGVESEKKRKVESEEENSQDEGLNYSKQ